jgi:hypothetical protein
MNKTVKAFIALLCIAIASLPGTYFLQYGIGDLDEPYQMLNALDYKNMPFAPLSNYFGNLFGSTFGFEWIKFRLLAYYVFVESITIGGIYLYKRTKAYGFTLLLTSLIIFTSGLFFCAHNVYGWDTYTLFFSMPLILLCVSYIESNKIWKLLVLSLLTAILCWCRVANSVVFLFVIAMLLFANYKKVLTHDIKKSVAIYTASSIVFIFAVLIMLYGSVGSYLDYLHANKMDNHGLYRLTIGYSFTFFEMLADVILIYAVYRIVDSVKNYNMVVKSGIYAVLILTLWIGFLWFIRKMA